jgi:hypothetical protein
VRLANSRGAAQRSKDMNCSADESHGGKREHSTKSKGSGSKENALVGLVGAVGTLAQRETGEELVLELHIRLPPPTGSNTGSQTEMRMKSTDSAPRSRKRNLGSNEAPADSQRTP